MSNEGNHLSILWSSLTINSFVYLLVFFSPCVAFEVAQLYGHRSSHNNRQLSRSLLYFYSVVLELQVCSSLYCQVEQAWSIQAHSRFGLIRTVFVYTKIALIWELSVSILMITYTYASKHRVPQNSETFMPTSAWAPQHRASRLLNSIIYVTRFEIKGFPHTSKLPTSIIHMYREELVVLQLIEIMHSYKVRKQGWSLYLQIF